MRRFGLADEATAYPDRLSGGQQQRAAVVRVLAMEPRLLPYLAGGRTSPAECGHG